VTVIWLAIFGAPAGPAAIFGAPDGIVVGWDAGFEATTGFEERRLWILRVTAWRNFADRRGASTVMVGNVVGLAEESLGSAGVGLTNTGVDCTSADAVCNSAGISATVKAS
jgi:hypothetical protein